MEITNSFRVPLPVEGAWEVLLDVPRIAPCMPGAKLISAREEDGAYSGELQVRLGPVLLTFRGAARMKEVMSSEHRAVVRAEGRDTKGRGSASADLSFSLAPEGDETRVDIITNLMLSGSVAQYGRSAGMIKDLADHMTGRFAENLQREILASAPAGNSGDPTASRDGAAGQGRSNGAMAQGRPDDGAAGEVSQKPISGLRLGLWLIWRQLVRLLRGARRP